MKKTIVVCDLEKYKLHESELKRCLTIGFRANDPKTQKDVFYKQNIEFYPEGVGKIEFDEQRSELVIRIAVKKNQFVAFGDNEGIAVKEKITALK